MSLSAPHVAIWSCSVCISSCGIVGVCAGLAVIAGAHRLHEWRGVLGGELAWPWPKPATIVTPPIDPSNDAEQSEDQSRDRHAASAGAVVAGRLDSDESRGSRPASW